MLLAACLLFSGLSYSQDLVPDEVPSIVLNSFNKSFPRAVEVEWQKKGELFNVEFDLKKRDHEVWLKKDGEIVKHEQEIKARELPEAVSTSIQEQFRGYRIEDVEKVEEGRQVSYKMELETITDEQKLVFDKNGKIIK